MINTIAAIVASLLIGGIPLAVLTTCLDKNHSTNKKPLKNSNSQSKFNQTISTNKKTEAKAIIVDEYTLFHQHNNRHSPKNIKAIAQRTNDKHAFSIIAPVLRGRNNTDYLPTQQLISTVEILKEAVAHHVKSIEVGYQYAGIFKYASGEWQAKDTTAIQYLQELNDLTRYIDISFTKLSLLNQNNHIQTQKRFQPLMNNLLSQK